MAYKKVMSLPRNPLLNVSFPELNKNDPLFLFYNFEELFYVKDNFSKLINNPSDLLKEYLLNSSSRQELSIPWFGSDNSFPLSKGQSEALQLNQSNQILTS